MAINLANVNLTIDQFQRVSDGKFNAGEVRLTSETELEKVNNHVKKTWLNKESISHAEVIAIKQAFVKALREGGVGDDALRRVREQLGLSPEKAVDTKLNERSLKPLSRQQIREILDENAAAINGTVGAGTIRTSDEIYADVEAKTRRTRATKRDGTNAELATRRTVTTERRIGLFHALVAGDADFHPRADRGELLKLADDLLDLVLQGAGGHPRAGIPAKAVLEANGGKLVEIETGMDEVAFVRKLEDAIVRLQGFGPDADTIRLRDTFRAVPREERPRWIDDLVQDGGDKTPYKVRTLCVALLQDAGVDDYESLSLPNRLPDAAVTSLLRNLAALPEAASAERARQCLDMARDLADDVVRRNQADVPATSTRDFNDAVVSAFANYNERLFGEYRALASDVLADVRAVFGPAIVPDDAKIRPFVNPVDVEAIAREQGDNVRLSAEAMRNGLKASALARAAEKALDARVEARLAELGIHLRSTATAVNSLKNRDPGLLGRLAACRTPAEVAAELDSVVDRIDVELRRASATQTFRAQFASTVRAELSAKTGIPVSALGGNVLSQVRIDDLAAGVAHKIVLGELPSDTRDQIEQAFLAEAKRFAAERAAILEKAEKLALSDAAKAELKAWLLAQDKVGYLDLDALLAEAGNIDFEPLATALREHKPKAEVYLAMKPFAENLRPTVARLLAGKVDEIGAPESGNVSTILLIAALDRHPGIRNDLAAFFARQDVRADAPLRGSQTHESFPSASFVTFGLPPAAEARTELARQIGAGTPPPVFAQALARAVKAEDIRYPVSDDESRSLSPEEAVAAFSAETKLGKALAEILESFPGELTPNALELLARGALRHHGVGNVAEMVHNIREKISKILIGDHFFDLPRDFFDAAQDVLDDMRRRFGAERVPEDASYNQVVDLGHLSTSLNPFEKTAESERRFMTVAEFRQAAEAVANQTLIVKVVDDAVKAVAQELGAGEMPGGFTRAFLQGNPELDAALRAAKTPDEVRAAIENARGTIRAAVELEARIAPVVRGAGDAMAAKLAARFGITAADAKRRFGYGYLLSNEMEKFRSGVRKGTYPGCREPGFSVEATLTGIMDRLVAQYAEKLAIVDNLQGVSDETRAALKAIIAKQQRPDKDFLDVRHAQKLAGTADGAALLAALDAPDATDESRFEAIRKYADDLEDAFRTEFPGAAELGSDDFLPVVSLVRAFLVGSVPGLGATLERLSADPFVLRVGTHFQQPEHHGHPMRATVGSTLF